MSLPKPYYQDDSVTLYNCDWREIWRELGTFDLLLTDPPYGIGEVRGRNKTRSCIATSKDYGDHSWDDSTPTEAEISTLCNMAIQNILWGGNYFSGLSPQPGWLVWDKDNGENDFADCELAWTNLGTAVRKLKWRWQGMLQEKMGNGKEDRIHPTQKPLALMAWCLSLVPNARTVFDPYAGSCTTGRACKDAGIKCVLVEGVEEYCEKGAKRLQQEVFNFAPPTVPKIEQPSFFP